MIRICPQLRPHTSPGVAQVNLGGFADIMYSCVPKSVLTHENLCFNSNICIIAI